MVEDVLQLDPVSRPDAQTSLDKVLALVCEPPAELDLGHADLLVPLEGNVAAHHVVQQDPQTPDGRRVAVVT